MLNTFSRWEEGIPVNFPLILIVHFIFFLLQFDHANKIKQWVNYVILNKHYKTLWILYFEKVFK